MTTIRSTPNAASVMVTMHDHEKEQLMDILTREGFHHTPDDISTWITRLTFLYLDNEIDLGNDYTHFDGHQMRFLIRFILEQRSEIPVKWMNIPSKP